jgi:hypothetical protein
MGLRIEDVPNFAADESYFEGLDEWLKSRDLRAIRLRFASSDDCSRTYFGYSDDHVILWGSSPRERDGRRLQHAVVGRCNGYGLEIIHDPHPSRDGLCGQPYGVMWIVPANVAERAA